MNSIFDKMYETIFGEKPSKLGTAFERFTAIALYLLEKGDVQHDARIRGELSQTLYQIDALYSTDSPTSKGMAEAKDYTVQGKKVGRGDLQKLAGALPDLKMVTEGSFFSATDYTRPARKYAEASAEITNGKRIRLYHLNIPRDGDEAGFIKNNLDVNSFSTPNDSSCKNQTNHFGQWAKFYPSQIQFATWRNDFI
ncbi:MAG: restriction endonuclease [Fibrobacteres bacterium]|nr:restriction endonuclease [Fibrobacterota bacterium]